MKKALVLALLLGLFAQGQAVQGEALWKRLCAQCHGGRAQGARPYPGLEAAAPLFRTPEGRRYLVLVLLYGKRGEAGLMPGFPQLDDEELAALLNHLMALLKVRAEPFNPEDIKRERGQNLAPDQIQRP